MIPLVRGTTSSSIEWRSHVPILLGFAHRVQHPPRDAKELAEAFLEDRHTHEAQPGLGLGLRLPPEQMQDPHLLLRVLHRSKFFFLALDPGH
eukprot:900600-Pyramimonas_sp.AAC.1